MTMRQDLPMGASDKALAPKPSFGGRSYARGTGLLVRGALPRMSRLKDRWHLPSAMILIEHNDTPVQSQPHRNMGSRNEGGLERTSRGLVTREAVCQLLPDVFLIPGVSWTKWDYI